MKSLLFAAVLAVFPFLRSSQPAQMRMTSQTVGANVSSSGSVASVNGNLDVYGTVQGDAIALRGDVIVHRGARIRGDAISIVGSVRNEGGTIDGRIRNYRSAPRMLTRSTALYATRGLWAGPVMTLAFLALVLIIGFGALVLGSNHLQRVAETLQAGVGKSFFAGILGGMAVAPAFVAMIVALAVTVIGILFIPLGILAFAVIVLGIATLGFIAVAQLTGRAMTRGAKRDTTERGAELRSLFVGMLSYIGLWAIVALLTPVPLVGSLARTFALAVTFVAFVTGFGAVILTGFRKSNGVATTA
jgi:hypothetical protein